MPINCILFFKQQLISELVRTIYNDRYSGHYSATLVPTHDNQQFIQIAFAHNLDKRNEWRSIQSRSNITLVVCFENSKIKHSTWYNIGFKIGQRRIKYELSAIRVSMIPYHTYVCITYVWWTSRWYNTHNIWQSKSTLFNKMSILLHYIKVYNEHKTLKSFFIY